MDDSTKMESSGRSNISGDKGKPNSNGNSGSKTPADRSSKKDLPGTKGPGAKPLSRAPRNQGKPGQRIESKGGSKPRQKFQKKADQKSAPPKKSDVPPLEDKQGQSLPVQPPAAVKSEPGSPPESKENLDQKSKIPKKAKLDLWEILAQRTIRINLLQTGDTAAATKWLLEKGIPFTDGSLQSTPGSDSPVTIIQGKFVSHWKDAVTRDMTVLKAFIWITKNYPLDTPIIDYFGSGRTAAILGGAATRELNLKIHNPNLTPEDQFRLKNHRVVEIPDHSLIYMNDVYFLDEKLLERLLMRADIIVWTGYLHPDHWGSQGYEGHYLQLEDTVEVFSSEDSRVPDYVHPSTRWLFRKCSQNRKIVWTLEFDSNSKRYLVRFTKNTGFIVPDTKECSLTSRKDLLLVDHSLWAVFLRKLNSTILTPVKQSLSGWNIGIDWKDELGIEVYSREVAQSVVFSCLHRNLTGLDSRNTISTAIASAYKNDETLNFLDSIGKLSLVSVMSCTYQVVLDRLAAYQERSYSIFDSSVLTNSLLRSRQLVENTPIFTPKKLVKPMVGLFCLWICGASLMNVNKTSKTTFSVAVNLLLKKTSLIALTVAAGLRVAFSQQNTDLQTRNSIQVMKENLNSLSPTPRVFPTGLHNIGSVELPRRTQYPIQNLGFRPKSYLVSKMQYNWSTFLELFKNSGNSRTFMKYTGFDVPFTLPSENAESYRYLVERLRRAVLLHPEKQESIWLSLDFKSLDFVPSNPNKQTYSYFGSLEWISKCEDGKKRREYEQALALVVSKGGIPSVDIDLMPKLDEFLAEAKIRPIANVTAQSTVFCGPTVEHCTQYLKSHWTPRESKQHNLREIENGKFGKPLENCPLKSVRFTWGSGATWETLTEWFSGRLDLGDGEAQVIACGDDVLVIAKWEKELFYIESDFSKYDQSQSLGPLVNGIKILELSGAHQEIGDHLMDVYNSPWSIKYRLDTLESFKLSFKHFPILPTGAATTTFSNTVNTLCATYYALCRTSSSKTLDCLKQSYAELGFEAKVRVTKNLGEVTFLKGSFVQSLGPTRKGEYVWCQLPSVPLKFGAPKRSLALIYPNMDPQERIRQYLNDVVFGWRTSPQNFVTKALIKAFLIYDFQMVDHIEKYKVLGTDEKLVPDVDNSSYEQRYNLDPQEMREFAEMTETLVPGLIVSHPVIEKLLKDYY